MDDLNIRHVSEYDLDVCYAIESACYTSDAASKEKIQKRIQLFPEGFLVAELNGQIIGMINSASTNKEDITDEAFKDMVDHVKDGKNIVIFSLAVLPEFRRNGISKKLMMEFLDVSKALKKRENSLNLQVRVDSLLPKVWLFLWWKIKITTWRL